jgi:hypothetical protein
VLARALLLLCESENLGALDELELNRLLFVAIANASRQLHHETGASFDYLPTYDGLQVPLGAATAEASERKRPDFAWTLLDHSAPSGLDGCREFVVECKRLGDKPGDATLSRRYVDNGVRRFVDPGHRYGLRGTSGVMVGYIQQSDVDTILRQVRDRLNHHSLADVVEEQPRHHPIKLQHMLVRVFGINPFLLFHYWCDVR